MNPKLLEKAAKLFRMANQSQSPEEAAVAAGKLQEFLTKYELDESVIQIKAGKSDNEIIDNEPIIDYGSVGDPLDNSGKSLIMWKASLSMLLAKYNSCKIYRIKGSLHIIGRPSDVATMRYLYEFLVSEVERLRGLQLAGHGKTWYNNFKMGVVDAIGEKLKESRENAFKDLRENSESTSLIVINKAIELVKEKDRRLQGWVAQNKRLRSGSGYTMNHDNQAREAGRKAGRTINMGTRG